MDSQLLSKTGQSIVMFYLPSSTTRQQSSRGPRPLTSLYSTPLRQLAVVGCATPHSRPVDLGLPENQHQHVNVPL